MTEPVSEDPTDRALAVAIASYTVALFDQVAASKGWPARLRLPAPRNAIEQRAMAMFLDTLAKETGAAMEVTYT